MQRLSCVIVAILSLLALPAKPQRQDLKFDHFGTGSGLSHSNVLCIMQDSCGFMWFGTRDGLNRYDGYTFTVYRNIPGNPHSLGNNYVVSMAEDKNKIMWFGTNGGGLNSYNRETNRFEAYLHDDKNPNSISSNYISAVVADESGNLWLGTDGAGVEKFDPVKKTFIHYSHKPGDANSLSSNLIRSINLDRSHNLWVGTSDAGLNLLDVKTGRFTHYRHEYNNPASLSNNDIYFLYQDSHGRYWVGTNGGGFNLFNRQTGTFTNFKNNPANAGSLPADVVQTVYEDEKGNLWLGTENGGLSIFNPVNQTFFNYQHDDVDNASISNNSIYAICKDTRGDIWLGTFSGGADFINADNRNVIHYRHSLAGNSLSSNKVLNIFEDGSENIWIGTDGGGLNMLNPRTGVFTVYQHRDGNKNSICGNYVLHVTEDSKHNLWVGTWADGLTVFNREKNTYMHFKNNPADAGSLSNNNVWYVYEDREQNIWVGTYGGGLDLYNPQTQKFTHYHVNANNPASINSNRIYAMYEDSKGRFWVGSDGGGLNLFDRKQNKFTHYVHSANSNSISDNGVGTITEDKDGKLWLGTTNGLNYFDPETNKFTAYTTASGLPNNVIFGILEDAKGNIWVSTNMGISKFDRKKNKFENFSPADGLQGTEFKEMAFCKTRAGLMYFGGNNGFNVFHPDSLQRMPYEPPLVLTDFRIFNTSVPVADSANPNSPLTKAITETKEITISYKDAVIAFQFASLNFCPSEKKLYQYKLEGFNKEWNDVRRTRTANYTNLDPGTYTFRVKGLDNQGNWSPHELSLTLIILPPFWRTWWFVSLCVLAVAGILLTIYRIRINIIKKQKASLEKQVEERTLQLNHSIRQERKARQNEEQARLEAEQANRAKSVFLATMSHEIRTPLNGVIGMSSLLADTQLTGEQEEYASTIKSCGESLMSVINDILDFSKIESGNMELEQQDFDLRTCIEEVLDVFAGSAAKTEIDLVYEIDHKVPSQIVGDMHRLRQVLMNLVSNAIKFTHKGEVFIGVHLGTAPVAGQLNIGFEVRDTGIGIPADKAHRLFKAFSQVDSSTTRKYGGTGLGLAICEKLVKLMGGDIGVQSRPGFGTTFSFSIITAASNQPQRKYVHYNHLELDGKHVLIVDDNSTNRRILHTQLEQWKLTPVLAASGKEALEMLSADDRFNLVITDMHMPEMDGIELTRLIKQKRPALPVVLLSSIGDEHSRKYPNLFNAVLNKPVKQHALYRCIIHELKAKDKTETAADASSTTNNSAKLAEQYPLQILIAEDNIINQRLIIHVLNKLGFAPEIAENGQEVLEKVVEKHFDIIFMDVQMPEIDGLEATRIIRSQQQRQPVIIAMTANATNEDRQECIAAGMDDYISKPIQLNKLIAMLESWAKRKMP